MPNDALVRASDPDTPVSELLLLAQDSLEIARAVAANPAIDEKVASVLSGRRNIRIDRGLAGNPSTPPELLVHLGEKHADLVLGNPSFELLLAADPSALKRIPEISLRQLASSSSVDPRCLVLMARMVESGSVATAILENPRTPTEALRHLASASRECVFDRSDVRLHIHDDSAPREDWWQPVEIIISGRVDKDDAALEQLARAGAIDSALRSAAIRRASNKVRAIALARSPLPIEAATALSQPEIEESRKSISKAVSARGADALTRLGLHDPEPVLSGVSLDGASLAPEATPAMLMGAVRAHVSWTTTRCLHLGNPYPDMRPMRAVAAHPNVDERVLDAMIDAHPFAARFAKIAAESRAATPDFLRKIYGLQSDPTIGDDWWSERPREGTTSFAVREVIASNPACPPDILRELLSQGSPALDRAIARNPSTARDLILELARRPDENTRAFVATRADLSPELVESLNADHSKAVKVALAASPSVTDPDRIIAWCNEKLAPIRAAAAARSGALPDSARPKLRADKSAEVRGAFASRPDLTADEQLNLAVDPSEKVRAILAANHQLLPETAVVLLRDGSQEVTIALAGNPSVDAAWLPLLLDGISGGVVAELTARGRQLLAKDPSPVDLGTVVALAASTPPKSAAFAIAITHAACPEAILRKRVKTGGWLDRALIASNPATPNDLRAELRGDWAWPVVAAANAAGTR